MAIRNLPVWQADPGDEQPWHARCPGVNQTGKSVLDTSSGRVIVFLLVVVRGAYFKGLQLQGIQEHKFIMMNRSMIPLLKGLAFSLAMALLFSLSSCASLPPYQEMSNARQALQSAHDVEAEKILRDRMIHIEALLKDAQASLDNRQFTQARTYARSARDKANQVRKVGWAILRASESIKNARTEKSTIDHLKNRLETAIRAAREGRDEEALQICNELIDATGRPNAN